MNLKAEITKITDIGKMADYGVMMTPALAIDGTLVSSGKVLDKDEIKKFLAKEEGYPVLRELYSNI